MHCPSASSIVRCVYIVSFPGFGEILAVSRKFYHSNVGLYLMAFSCSVAVNCCRNIAQEKLSGVKRIDSKTWHASF